MRFRFDRPAFVLTFASLTLATSAVAASYFPSAPGTTWRLSNGEVQKLLQSVVMRGVRVTPLQHVIKGKLVSEDLLEFRTGGVFLRGTRVGGKVTWYEPPLTVYPSSPLSPGQSWTSTSGGLTITARVLGQEALVTEAGRFNALVIRNDVTTVSGASSSSFSYFVPGLGTVRYVSGNGSTVDLLK